MKESGPMVGGGARRARPPRSANDLGYDHKKKFFEAKGPCNN